MDIGGNSGELAAVALQTILGLSGCCLLILLVAAAVRIRVRLPRPPISGPVGRLAPVLGFALALAGGPARAERHIPIAPPVHTRGATPPWSEASGFPPPRPLARIEAHTEGAPSILNDATTKEERSDVHPALHARRSGSSHAPLFPRTSRSADARERAEAMLGHPAGKAVRTSTPGRSGDETLTRYVVRDGDTLWSIAQRELQTEDIRSIARFWPKIHRANRHTIADPSLIMPGQILLIPDTKEG